MSKEGLQLSFNELDNIFPYFVLLSKDFIIEKVGKSIHKIFPEYKLGEHFFENWDVVKPHVAFDYKTDFESIIGKLCAIKFEKRKSLVLKGHFEKLESNGKYIFYGNPAFNSTDQIIENKLTLSDFSLNDTTFDLLHLLKTNEIANNELKELIQKVSNQKKDLALFKQIFDSTSDAIQVSLEDGQLVYINTEASIRLGISIKEINNFRVHDFEELFKKQPEIWVEHVEELKHKDHITIEGINFNKKTQKQFPVEVTAKYMEFGGIGYIVAISRDISERKKNEKVLKIQEEKYRNIISNMNLGLLEVDIDGKIIMCNSSFEQLSGYKLEEVLGKDASSIFGKGETLNILNDKVELRKTGNTDSYEVLVKNKRGEAKWWFVSGATNFNDEGKITGSVGIHLDITDQKNLEKELEEALIKSQEASKSKEAFLANMSHEIRTPLNGILGMIQALKAENLNNDQGKFVESAYIASEHLLSIINNVLDITKIEAGELELINKSFSLNKVVNDIETILKNQVNRHISLITEVKDINTTLVGDETRLRQVLINILGNAIKFTEKGSVKLICKGSAPENGKQAIKIEVIDTGIGIEEAAIGQMFQKFHQEDAGISRKFGGSGLGLVITKELIELMDGSIDLQSKKGQGTTITIKLQLPIGEEISKVTNNEFKNYEDLSGLNILLVEDNDMNRLVVKHSLSKTNVNLTEVINGKEAIESLKENHFDLVLMDVQMPIMGGMEATTIIRKDLKLELPIIALSANAFKSEIDACLAIGFNDYIIKPFDRNTLLKAIHSFCVSENKQIGLEKETNEILYDLKELEGLAMGDQEFMNSMIDLFIDIIPKSVQEIQDAFETKDYENLGKIAHRIKPSIDNMGISSLKKPIRDLEKFDLESNGLSKLEELVELVSNTLNTVISQLKTARK